MTAPAKKDDFGGIAVVNDDFGGIAVVNDDFGGVPATPAAAPPRLVASHASGPAPADLSTRNPVNARPTDTESALRGGVQGLTLGFGDEMTGGVAALASLLRGEGVDRAGQVYEYVRDRQRGLNADARDENPWAYGLTEAAGATLPFLATGGASSAPGAAGGLARTAAAGVTGAAAGAGLSEGETAGDVAVDATIGGLAGAGAQAALGELLMPYLATKLATRARDLNLQKHGLTRAQVRAIRDREGPLETDQALDDIDRVLRESLRRYKGTPQERAAQAYDAAKQGIRDFHRQADQLVEPPGGIGPRLPAVTPAEVDEAALAQLARQETEMGRRGWGAVADEAANLTRDPRGFERLHDWSIQARTKLYPKGGGPPPADVDADQMRAFIQELQERGRARALSVTPADAPVSPAAFEKNVRDYRALSDLDRMSRQQTAYETGFRGLLSKVNHRGVEGMGGLVAAGGAALQRPGVAVAGASLAALAAAAGSPTVNRAAATALRGAASPAGQVAGKAALFPALEAVVGQRRAAEEFAAGETPGPEYIPPSPLNR